MEKKIAILNDIHYPFANQEFVDRACIEIRDEKPDVIVVNGDVLDFPGLSKYGISPTLNYSSLETQMSLARSFFSDLRKENPDAKIYFTEGNHEFRMKSYVIRETGKMDRELREKIYRAIDLKKDLDLGKLNIKFIATMYDSPKWTDTYVDIEGIKIGHFDTVANPTVPAGMTIRKLMMKYGHINIVQAHIHRAAIIWNTDMDDNQVFGMEVPALCRPPFYRRIVNWQYGYGIIEKIDGKWSPRLKVF